MVSVNKEWKICVIPVKGSKFYIFEVNIVKNLSIIRICTFD
jgi:hypothetical protein